MRNVRLWRALLGVDQRTVIEDIEFEVEVIGIDEISYKRHHKYLTCVVDHDSGLLVWAAPWVDMANAGAGFSTPSASSAAS